MYLPGSLLMSQLSCFLEMLVQLRSRAAGCLRMMPLSMRGVMDLQRFRFTCFQSLLSQHLARHGVLTDGCCVTKCEDMFSTAQHMLHSPSVPGPADTHAHTKISVSQVAEHRHPHLPSHHVRFTVGQRESVRRRADGRGPDHMTLHLDAFWR